MITPGYLPLTAYRQAAFSVPLTFRGTDKLDTATLHMQVRTQAGDIGTPVVDLPLTTNLAITGISKTSVTTVNGVIVSVFKLYIPHASAVTAFANVLPATDVLTLAYDLMVTPSGGDPMPWLYGPFTLYPGVTV
jgi:hypothetical protein